LELGKRRKENEEREEEELKNKRMKERGACEKIGKGLIA
jgi:hypothetical protein